MSRANRRFYRTLLLGLASLGVLIWVASDRFGISYQNIANLFLGTLGLAFGVILVAALCAGLWIGVRRLLHRGDAG